MKQYFYYWLLFLPFFSTAQGIEFSDISLKQALELARKHKKMVFADFTADWCKPCKKMEAEVFNDPEIGAKMNAFFVCVQFDFEGNKSLADKYGFSSIPTTLCLDSTGELLRKTTGYGIKSYTIEQLNGMIHLMPNGKKYLTAEEMFNKKQNPTMSDLAKFLAIRRSLSINNAVFLERFKKQIKPESLQNDTIQQFFAEFNTDLTGDIFELLISQKNNTNIRMKLQIALIYNLQEAVKRGDKALLKNIQKTNERLYDDPSVVAVENDYLLIEFYRKTDDEKRFHKSAMDFIKKYGKTTTTEVAQKMDSLKAHYESGSVKNQKYCAEFAELSKP
jgi:thioredoxin-related protein